MPGYLNRFIDIDFSEYGEGCFVRIHNPKVVPSSMLEPTQRVQLDANNQPVDPEVAKEGSREVTARLIKDWKMYDATVIDEDEQPPLTLPATAESVKKLPMGVYLRLQKEISGAVPNPN